MNITHPLPPLLRHTLMELPRGALDCKQLLFGLTDLGSAECGRGQPVILVPGFGGGDLSTSFLRRWLSKRGFDASSWGQGRNLPSTPLRGMQQAMAFRRSMAERLSQRVCGQFEKSGCKVSLVGWSLGGLYAIDVARQHPEKIEQVITLGTPFGDPRGTSVWSVMRRLYGDRAETISETDFEEWLNHQRWHRCPVPTTVIYSNVDGFVGTGIARFLASGVDHFAVKSSHIGITANRDVFRIIAGKLAQGQV